MRGALQQAPLRGLPWKCEERAVPSGGPGPWVLTPPTSACGSVCARRISRRSSSWTRWSRPCSATPHGPGGEVRREPARGQPRRVPCHGARVGRGGSAGRPRQHRRAQPCCYTATATPAHRFRWRRRFGPRFPGPRWSSFPVSAMSAASRRRKSSTARSATSSAPRKDDDCLRFLWTAAGPSRQESRSRLDAPPNDASAAKADGVSRV